MATKCKNQLHFYLFKIHSLTGIAPIGVFLVVHLSLNSFRTVSVEQYRFSIDIINNLPFLLLIEIGLIYVPLLFHSAIGFYIICKGESNFLRYPYPRNGLYTLQRYTGGVVFVFLVYHIATTVVPKWTENKHLLDAGPFLIGLMNEEFHSWTGRIIYIIGILSATFHFTNGLWGFCVSWGILNGRNSQRNGALAFTLVGIILIFLGLATVFEFSANPIPAKV